MPGQSGYDVIVVGSGAAGGIAAYVLATKGLNVLCLEAGRMLHTGKDFYPHKFAYEWPYRGQGKPGQYGKLPQGMEWKIEEWTDHLYTIPEDVYNTPTGKHLLPPFNARCGEMLIKKGATKLGIKLLAKPLAVLSKPYDGRPACHYCGACGHGCDTRSRYCSAEVLIPKLQAM